MSYSKRHKQFRRVNRTLLASAVIAGIGFTNTQAATISVDGVTCTLTDAITAANTDAATGGCTSGTGADVLAISATTIDLVASLPDIESDITVNGNGVTISGDQTFRLMQINSGSLTLNDTILTQGGAPGNNPGGGLVCNDSQLTISNLAITNTRAGALIFRRCTGSLDNSIIDGNVGNDFSNNNSGGISILSSDVTIEDSTISNNVTNNGYGDDGGGGIFINNTDGNSTLTVNNSTIVNNFSTVAGGGIGHRNSNSGNSTTLNLNNVTLSSNSSDAGGGGMFLDNTVIAVGANLTITANTTSGGGTGTFYGGGIFNNGADITLVQTIVSGNEADYGSGNEIESFSGTVTLDGTNVLGFSGDAGVSGATAGPSDIVPTQTLNELIDITLADNGGPTQTHAVPAGSVALDVAGLSSCITATDQRGQPRPADGDGNGSAECDIGAFEADQVILDADLVVDISNNAPVPVQLGTQFQIALTASNNGPADATGVTVLSTVSGQLTVLSNDCGASVAGNAVTWVLGDLANAASAVCNLTTEVSGTGLITNSASITGDQNDPVNNNTSADTIAGAGTQSVPTLSWFGLMMLSFGLFWIARRKV